MTGIADSVVQALAKALGIVEPVVASGADTWAKLRDSELVAATGLLLADPIHRAVCSRRIRFAAEIGEELRRRGVSARVLPEGFALQALEAGAFADDPDVRRMWTNLVANAVEDPTKAHPFVVETLRKLSGEDARVLQRVAAAAPVPERQLPAVGSIDEEGLLASLARLNALGLLDPPWTGYSRKHLTAGQQVTGALSTVGEQFMETVHGSEFPADRLSD